MTYSHKPILCEYDQRPLAERSAGFFLFRGNSREKRREYMYNDTFMRILSFTWGATAAFQYFMGFDPIYWVACGVIAIMSENTANILKSIRETRE